MRATTTAGLLALMAAIASCSDQSGQAEAIPPEALSDRTFEVVRLTVDDYDRPVLPHESAGTPTLAFDDETVVVQSGCNGMSATYALESDRLRVGEIGSEGRLCDEDRNVQQDVFITLLDGDPTIRVDRDQLILRASGIEAQAVEPG